MLIGSHPSVLIFAPLESFNDPEGHRALCRPTPLAYSRLAGPAYLKQRKQGSILTLQQWVGVPNKGSFYPLVCSATLPYSGYALTRLLPQQVGGATQD